MVTTMSRRETIEDHKTKLNNSIKRLRKEIDSLDAWLRTESYFGEEFLTNPAASGLSSLLGKMKKSSDVWRLISEIESTMEECPLKSADFYKSTSPILRDLHKQATDRCSHWEQQVKKARRPVHRRERKVRAYFAEVYRSILEDLIDIMQKLYRKRRGDTKRTTCGEPCSTKDGPCERIVWEGWACWQHGGGMKDIDD